MPFSNQDLKRVESLIAIKDTMPLEEYISKLKAMKSDIINDIEVDVEIEFGGDKVLRNVNKILKTTIMQ